MIFACAVTSAKTESQACLLAGSIRTFAGRFSDSPIWALNPQDRYPLSDSTVNRFAHLGVQSFTFEAEPLKLEIPFTGKVFASAEAETLAEDQAELLVWLDPDSIVIQEPRAMVLDPGKLLACRPVDHILIGSPYDQPADAFWHTIYQTCDVPRQRLFPMTTSADETRIRPYMNAGLLVVQPDKGLLRRWRDQFRDALESGIFEPYLTQDVRHKIFLHQAILAGVILSALKREQIQILSHLVNYPLHMHGDYPPRLRPARMNDLISGRYDTFFGDPEWPMLFPSDEPLRSWLVHQLVIHGLVGS